MIILTTAFNCEKYIDICISSIKSQSFKDFTCYITDDLSTDGTVDKVKKIIEGDDRFVLIENKNKLYQPGNYDNIIRGLNINDEEICVEVDGDDWLPNKDVFLKINDVYNQEDIWITSGSFRYSNGRLGFSKPPINFDNIRNEAFTLSHLRTWKSWLWKKILPEDLKDEDGNYWGVAGDLSFMYPMVEMSGQNHFKFLTDINYVYNEENPLNDHKVNYQNVVKSVRKLRLKPKYSKI